MGILELAEVFIRVAAERRRLEEEEKRLRADLEEFFRHSPEKTIQTEQGTVSWVETKSVTWDAAALKKALPPRLWRTVSTVVVNGKLIEELVKDGQIAPEAVALCRREERRYRLVSRPTASAGAPGKTATR